MSAAALSPMRMARALEPLQDLAFLPVVLLVRDETLPTESIQKPRSASGSCRGDCVQGRAAPAAYSARTADSGAAHPVGLDRRRRDNVALRTGRS